MIKNIILFISGFVIGSILVFVLIYAIGYILELAGIILYDSENDQQKNFNIAMVIWLLVSVASGYLATKLKLNIDS